MAKATKKSSTAGKSVNLKTKLHVIKTNLRRGDISEIAARIGYDQSHVSRVLRGIRNNEAIVNAAYSRLSKRKVTA